MLCEKSFENFFDTPKKIFTGLFFRKKNLENFLRAENFSNFFLNFFSKKVCWKKQFLECQKKFQKDSYIFFWAKNFAKKKKSNVMKK